MMRSPRRRALVLLLCFVGGCSSAPSGPRPEEKALLEDLARRTFDFFWERANPANGLVPDRWPTPSFSSIAAVGFGLTAYPIGVERGYITRAAARERVLTTLRFFRTTALGHRGFFYHFVDMETGQRFGRVELSTVDTALLLAGALFCQGYFAGGDPAEVEIRALAEELYRAADWRWAAARPPGIAMGWTPEEGFHGWDWRGYNEAMLVYLLALGSPTHAVDTAAWSVWTSQYPLTWGTFEGQQYLAFAPLFGHQYSHAWVDYRGIRDAFGREHDLDYFENSRRAVYAHRSYALTNPEGWAGYGAELWGLSACDGPADVTLPWNGKERRFRTYAARGASHFDAVDDGTLAPTAAAASIAFAPEIVIPAIAAMKERFGAHLYGRYGFFDAFNPSFTFDVPLHHGEVVPGLGWFDTDYLGIDQGPILVMLENYQTGLVWRVMRKNPHLRRGLERAGFSGGWLAQAER